MARISMGKNFDEADTMAKKERERLPADTYDLRCTECKLGQYSKSQRGMVEFHLEVQAHSNPDFNGKKLRHTCPLPDGGDFSGIGFLTETCVALGHPWEGDQFDTDDYVGRSGRANITLSEPNAEGRQYNNIGSWAV